MKRKEKMRKRAIENTLDETGKPLVYIVKPNRERNRRKRGKK